MDDPLDVPTVPVPSVWIPSFAWTTGACQERISPLIAYFFKQRLTDIPSPAGFWVFHASLWLPSAEEHCSVASKQRTHFGEGDAETTAPSAGQMREDSFPPFECQISAAL